MHTLRRAQGDIPQCHAEPVEAFLQNKDFSVPSDTANIPLLQNFNQKKQGYLLATLFEFHS